MDVEVAMTAWTRYAPRVVYFQKAMESLRDKLSAARHCIARIIVSSERVPEPFMSPFEAICREHKVDLHYHPGEPEIGRNLNHLWSLCEAPYVLSTECDNVLEQPLDLSPHITFLEDCKDFVMVRYNPGGSPLVKDLGNGLAEISPDDNWIYSNTAHLKHRVRFSTLGRHASISGWGGQELDMGQKVRTSALRVACVPRQLRRGKLRPLVVNIGHRCPANRERWVKGSEDENSGSWIDSVDE